MGWSQSLFWVCIAVLVLWGLYEIWPRRRRNRKVRPGYRVPRAASRDCERNYVP